MIKVFCGEDIFESYSNAKKEVRKISNDQNYKIINCDENFNVSDLIREVEGFDMFSGENAFLLLKRISKNKTIEDFLTNYYEKCLEEKIVIWEEGKVDLRNKFFKMVNNDGNLFNYETPKDIEMRKWLKDRLDGIKFSDILITKIIENSYNSKFVLENYIKKFKTFRELNNQDLITEKDLDNLIGLSAKGDIWRFTDYFGNRNRKKSIEEYIKLVEFEDNGQYIIAMIQRELDLLFSLKKLESEGLPLKELRLHPFVLEKTIAKSKKFSINELKELIRRLFNLDLAIKNGELNEKIGISLFLLNI